MCGMKSGAKSFSGAPSVRGGHDPIVPQLLREGQEAKRGRLVFAVGQRVRIARGHAEDDFDFTPLIGQCGTVAQLNRAACSAWVRMDEELPVAFRSFPRRSERANWLGLWPEDCEVSE